MVLGSSVCAAAFVLPAAGRGAEEAAFLSLYLGIFLIGLVAMIYTECVDPIREPPESAVELEGSEHKQYTVCPHCDNEKPMKDTTKHCIRCNKCVSHFDHHCLYLNTCIGARNYFSFFVLITSIVVLQALHIVLQIVLLVQAGNRDPDVIERIEAMGLTRVAYLTLASFFLLVPTLVFGLVLSLLCFHVYIQYIGSTTYLWIRNKKYTDHLREQAELKASQERRQRQEEAKYASRGNAFTGEAIVDKFVTDVTQVSEGVQRDSTGI